MSTTTTSVGKPIPLFYEDGPKPVFWLCGKCGRQFPSEELVLRCWTCVPRKCGRDDCSTILRVQSCYTACRPCRDVTRAEKESAQFEAAEKIPAHSYEDPVVHGDKWYPDWETMFDSLDEVVPIGPVWACVKHYLQLDIDCALESGQVSAGPFDGWDGPEWDDETELREFVRAWNAKQSGHWWEEDRSRAIVDIPGCAPAESAS